MLSPSRPSPTPIGHVARAFKSLRGWIASVALFSGLINLLALTGSIFMRQV